jgi:AcrR family transcriptional regulator
MKTHEGTDDRILDAAMELFSDLGYAGTTTRAIAARAGVNEVTLFRNFGSKRNLFVAAIRRETDVSGELEEFPFEISRDLEEDLTTIGLRITEAMTSRAPLIRIMMTEASRDHMVWDSISETPPGHPQEDHHPLPERTGGGHHPVRP